MTTRVRRAETRHLWGLTSRLAKAVADADEETIDEYTEAVELFALHADDGLRLVAQQTLAETAMLRGLLPRRIDTLDATKCASSA